mmetsp:Transcript_8949/g.23437  ORF Transcript_8949/g.23437 Transcript_8949/m.23437 type:complete len:160 (+) Transcript_8949:18-497(+)
MTRISIEHFCAPRTEGRRLAEMNDGDVSEEAVLAAIPCVKREIQRLEAEANAEKQSQCGTDNAGGKLAVSDEVLAVISASVAMLVVKLAARDVELFARHAKRVAVTGEDILLLARRAPLRVQTELKRIAASLPESRKSTTRGRKAKGAISKRNRNTTRE